VKIEPPLLVVTGPTASGKTALAVALAERLGGELVGADSVQVYRGFDIGSSKPSAQELRGIAHHLLDVREPDQPLDAAEFAALADAAIAEVRDAGKLPIVVGGSGLWLRALLRGLVKAPDVDPALRSALMADAERLGTPALHTRLAAVDEDAARAIHPNDRVRVVRALEVHQQTGQALGALRKQHALGAPRYRALRLVVELPAPELDAQIRERTARMIEQGFADEVTRLVARFGRDLRALGAVGYREMVGHVCDGTSLEQTLRAIERSTRVYARRQRTWLRNEPGDRWLTRSDEVLADSGLARLQTFLEGA